jgi:hypothetical protein
MTALERGMELLATIETHHVAAQPMEVYRLGDGTIEVVACPPYWTENPFTTWDGSLWCIEREEWGSVRDVYAWTGVPDGDQDGLGHEVICGDVASLDLLERALAELKELARYAAGWPEGTGPGTPIKEVAGWDHPSGADMVDAVAEMLARLGLTVPCPAGSEDA